VISRALMQMEWKRKRCASDLKGRQTSDKTFRVAVLFLEWEMMAKHSSMGSIILLEVLCKFGVTIIQCDL